MKLATPVMTPQKKQETAMHEAGHTVAAWSIGMFLRKATIVPRGTSLGEVRHFEISNHTTIAYARRRVLFLFAGPAAGSVSPGWKGEFGDEGPLAWFDELSDIQACGLGRKGSDYSLAITTLNQHIKNNHFRWRELCKLAYWTEEFVRDFRVMRLIKAVAAELEQYGTLQEYDLKHVLHENMEDGDFRQLYPLAGMGRKWRQRFWQDAKFERNMVTFTQ